MNGQGGFVYDGSNHANCPWLVQVTIESRVSSPPTLSRNYGSNSITNGISHLVTEVELKYPFSHISEITFGHIYRCLSESIHECFMMDFCRFYGP